MKIKDRQNLMIEALAACGYGEFKSVDLLNRVKGNAAKVPENAPLVRAMAELCGLKANAQRLNAQLRAMDGKRHDKWQLVSDIYNHRRTYLLRDVTVPEMTADDVEMVIQEADADNIAAMESEVVTGIISENLSWSEVERAKLKIAREKMRNEQDAQRRFDKRLEEENREHDRRARDEERKLMRQPVAPIADRDRRPDVIRARQQHAAAQAAGNDGSFRDWKHHGAITLQGKWSPF